MKKVTLAVVAITCLGCAATAFAGDAGWYLFGAAGQTVNDNSKQNIDNALTSVGGRGFSSNQNKATLYNLDVGYQVNRNFAVEGGYIGSSNQTYNASGGNLGGAISSSANISGWDLKAVGLLPVANRFSLLGKLGVADISESVSVTGPGGTAYLNGSKTDVTYGIGAKYDFTDAFSGRFDIDRYSIGSSTDYSRTDVWTVGVAYKF